MAPGWRVFIYGDIQAQIINTYGFEFKDGIGYLKELRRHFHGDRYYLGTRTILHNEKRFDHKRFEAEIRKLDKAGEFKDDLKDVEEFIDDMSEFDGNRLGEAWHLIYGNSNCPSGEKIMNIDIATEDPRWVCAAVALDVFFENCPELKEIVNGTSKEKTEITRSGQ